MVPATPYIVEVLVGLAEEEEEESPSNNKQQAHEIRKIRKN